MFDDFLGLLFWMTSCFCLPLVSCNRCWSWEVRTDNIHQGFLKWGVLMVSAPGSHRWQRFFLGFVIYKLMSIIKREIILKIDKIILS